MKECNCNIGSWIKEGYCELHDVWHFWKRTSAEIDKHRVNAVDTGVN